MKVTFRERYFIDRFRCIDKEITRSFDKKWESGGLTYFKLREFTIFTVETNFIIRITQ